jgi:hypothetical protein
MDFDALEQHLNEALNSLYTNHLELLKIDAGERTICSELAALLSARFALHRVNVEYNRHGIQTKAVLLPDRNGRLSSTRVTPDIVVHQIGHDRDNLLVVEAKKKYKQCC